MKKMLALTVLMMFTMMSTACSFKNSEKYEVYAWQALAVAATTYNETMATLGKLHTEGTISDEVASKAIWMGKQFTPLYKAAVASLKVFVVNPTDSAEEAVRNTLNAALSSLDYLVEFAKGFGVDKKAQAESTVTEHNAEDIATTAINTLAM